MMSDKVRELLCDLIRQKERQYSSPHAHIDFDRGCCVIPGMYGGVSWGHSGGKLFVRSRSCITEGSLEEYEITDDGIKRIEAKKSAFYSILSKEESDKIRERSRQRREVIDEAADNDQGF